MGKGPLADGAASSDSRKDTRRDLRAGRIPGGLLRQFEDGLRFSEVAMHHWAAQ